MHLVARAVHAQFTCRVSDVAEPAQVVRELAGYIVIQVERCHLGSVEHDLRVDDSLMAPVVR